MSNIPYKDKLFDLIIKNCDKFDWIQDNTVNYFDFSTKIQNDVSLRIVNGPKERAYLQVINHYNYRIYEENEYPEIKTIIDSINNKIQYEKDINFFKNMYTLVETFINK